MMVQRASRSSWHRPAQGVRRLLGTVFRRRAVGTLDNEFGQPLAPAVEDAPGLIRESIEALVAAGALDEGTAPVLDPKIKSWVNQWSARVEQQHRGNQSQLQHREIEARAERDRIRAELELLSEERNAVDRCIAHLSQQPPAPSP